MCANNHNGLAKIWQVWYVCLWVQGGSMTNITRLTNRGLLNKIAQISLKCGSIFGYFPEKGAYTNEILALKKETLRRLEKNNREGSTRRNLTKAK